MLSYVVFLCRSFLVHEARVSTCELEVDVQATDIVNRKEIGMGECPGSGFMILALHCIYTTFTFTQDLLNFL